MQPEKRRFTLVIGTKNLSSWSLRPWLVMKQFKIPFHEIELPLHTPEFEKQIGQYSPSGRVPVLIDMGESVWDSLSICEYLNEQFPKLGLWPADHEARAVARSISAEMHSGFTDLRKNMPMNVYGDFPGQGRKPEVEADIDRIQAIWADARSRFGKTGNFLFGAFSIADAMFAPVVFRFRTYAVTLNPAAAAYSKTILALPAVKEWMEGAKAVAHTGEALKK